MRLGGESAPGTGGPGQQSAAAEWTLQCALWTSGPESNSKFFCLYTSEPVSSQDCISLARCVSDARHVAACPLTDDSCSMLSRQVPATPVPGGCNMTSAITGCWSQDLARRMLLILPLIGPAEWRPPASHGAQLLPAQLLYGCGSGRLHLEVFARRRVGAAPLTAALSPSDLCHSGSCDLQPSAANSPTRQLARQSRSCSASQEVASAASSPARLRTSDSVDSIELQASGCDPPGPTTATDAQEATLTHALDQAPPSYEANTDTGPAKAPTAMETSSSFSTAPAQPDGFVTESASAPAATSLISPFASTNGAGVDGDSEGGSDYETASEDGGATLEHRRSGSPIRLRYALVDCQQQRLPAHETSGTA